MDTKLENANVKDLNTTTQDEAQNEVFDLIENKKELEEEVKNSGLYFSMEEGVSYKVKLKTTQIKRKGNRPASSSRLHHHRFCPISVFELPF